MTLRNKLLLAQTPLVAALLCGAAVAIGFGASLGRGPRSMFEQNYRSVLAGERMKDALHRVAREALGPAKPDADAFAAARRSFDRALKIQTNNITEEGEDALTDRVATRWRALMGTIEQPAAGVAPEPGRAPAAHGLRAAIGAIEQDLNALVALNHEAMLRKTDRAEAHSARLRDLVLAVLGLGLVLALVTSAMLTTRLLRPLGVLAATTRRLSQGDLAARARVQGADEIAALAGELNQLAEQLGRYRKSSLGELLEAQQAAQAAMDCLPDPMIVLAVDGRVQNVNRAAEALLGLRVDPEGALAELPEPLRAEVSRVAQHVLQGRGAYVPGGLGEALRLHAHGTEHALLPRARPVHGEGGALVGVALLLEDVTRLLRLEALRTDLVASVAHELRTPLTSLHMAIHLCHDELVGPLNERQLDLLHTARGDCERLQSMVDELLDLSRIQSGQLVLHVRAFDADALVRDALESARTLAPPGLHLRAEVPPGLPALLADPERTRIVLANLLSNALRHSPPGPGRTDAIAGSPALGSGDPGARESQDHASMARRPSEKVDEVLVRVTLAPSGDRMRFTVLDRGAGVPEQYREAIFEKYFQVPSARIGGAGLGLHIAKEIVAAHGGDIGVTPREGGGSAFWFELPLEGPAS